MQFGIVFIISTICLPIAAIPHSDEKKMIVSLSGEEFFFISMNLSSISQFTSPDTFSKVFSIVIKLRIPFVPSAYSYSEIDGYSLPLRTPFIQECVIEYFVRFLPTYFFPYIVETHAMIRIEFIVENVGIPFSRIEDNPENPRDRAKVCFKSSFYSLEKSIS